MIGNTVRLGRLFEVELRLHYSWLIVFVLLVRSLAGVYFPRLHPGWQDATY